MKINREEFVCALESVKPAIPTNSGPDYDKKVVLSKGMVTAYSDYLCMSTEFDLEIDFAIVPSDKLLAILKKIESDEIDIALVQQKLKIKGGDFKSEIMCTTDPESFLYGDTEAIFESCQLAKPKKVPDQFIDAIRLCMYGASKDKSNPIAACVFASKNKVMASDDFQISVFEMDKPIKDDLLLNAKACGHMVKFFEEFETVKYFVTDTWNFFSVDEGMFIAIRKIIGEYPDVEMIEHLEFEGSDFVLPPSLVDKIKQVSVLASGHDVEKEIKVILKDGKATVRAESDEGWAESSVKSENLNTEGSTITFITNPTLLSEIVQRVSDVKLGETRAKFVDGSFTHLIQLGTE